MTTIAEARRDRNKTLMSAGQDQVRKAINEMIESDPVLKRAVEFDEHDDFGLRYSMKVCFKEGELKEEDTRSFWNTIAKIQWREGKWSMDPPFVTVSQTGWRRDKMAHATYRFRKDGTVNVEKLVERVRSMCIQTIASLDVSREIREESRLNLDAINKKYPWTFNEDRECQVGTAYGLSKMTIKSSYDHELSVKLEARGLKVDEVKMLEDFIQKIRKRNHEIDDEEA